MGYSIVFVGFTLCVMCTNAIVITKSDATAMTKSTGSDEYILPGFMTKIAYQLVWILLFGLVWLHPQPLLAQSATLVKIKVSKPCSLGNCIFMTCYQNPACTCVWFSCVERSSIQSLTVADQFTAYMRTFNRDKSNAKDVKVIGSIVVGPRPSDDEINE